MSPADEDVARLDGDSVAALRAWADIDRFQLPEVPLDNDDGWSAVGELSAIGGPTSWPPRPEKSPEKQRKVLDTRVMFGCLEVARLERLLDELFADDERFVQTGIRSAKGLDVDRRRSRADLSGILPGGRGWRPGPDSFSYAPLIDFTRYVEHHRDRSVSMQKVVSDALTWIDQREATLNGCWEQSREFGTHWLPGGPARAVAGSGAERSLPLCHPMDLAGRPAGGTAAGVLRGDLLAAANAPTSALPPRLPGGSARWPTNSFEDVEFRADLEPLLDPGLAPRSAWPSGHRLRLSQQVALTAILDSNGRPTVRRERTTRHGQDDVDARPLRRSGHPPRRGSALTRRHRRRLAPSRTCRRDQSAVAALCARSRAVWFRDARRFEQ